MVPMHPRLFAVSCLFLLGCATQGSLPDAAQEVDFEAPAGKVGWAQYERTEFYPKISEARFRGLAADALRQTRFEVLLDDAASGCIKGEHGATRFDWNVMAGVYYRQEQGGVRVRYIIEASKDIGIFGDKTDRDWISEIHGRIRVHLP